MDHIEECTRTRSVLKVLGPIANQVVELRGRQGTECDAPTIIKLLKLCTALRESCALLPERLADHARLLGDSELEGAAGRAGRRLERVVDTLTDATRDLFRDGDVCVRDNNDVWLSITEATEQLLSGLTDVLVAWDRSQLRRLTAAADQVRFCLTRFHQPHNVDNLVQEFQLLVSCVAALRSLVVWRCEQLSDRSQQVCVKVLCLQLRTAMTLLARVCVASATSSEGKDDKHAKTSRELVVSRVRQVVANIVTQAGTQPTLSHRTLQEPASFTNCIDKLLNLLLDQEEKKTDKKDDGDNWEKHSEEMQDDTEENSLPEEKIVEKDDNEWNTEKEGKADTEDNEGIQKDIRKGEGDKNGQGSDEGREKLCVSVRVRPLLEEALRHSLAMACCAAPHDHKAIMAACENLLKQVKVLIHLEQQPTPDPVDCQIARDTLADMTEILEQHVNTALIRLIAQTFANPLAPLQTLMEGVEENRHRISESDTGTENRKEYVEGRENIKNKIANNEESKTIANKKTEIRETPMKNTKQPGNQEIGIIEGRNGDGEGDMETEESRLDSLIADFDLHVDHIFQAGGLAIACTSDPRKVNIIQASLGTLEWLEGCLVPALLTAARSPSTTQSSTHTDGSSHPSSTHTSIHTTSSTTTTTPTYTQVHSSTQSSTNNQSSTSTSTHTHSQSSSSSSSSPGHPPSQTHAHLLSEHWTEAVERLGGCLDAIMDPGAFVMVSQQEVHRVWAAVRSGLYSQDTQVARRQAGRVAHLVSRIIYLHQRQCREENSAGFLTDTQVQDFLTAVKEVKAKSWALSAAPSELSRHRSLLKRVQLCLTLLSRLSHTLNPSYEEEETRTGEESCPMEPPPKLTKHEQEQLLTSDIKDIPVDLATPQRRPPTTPSQQPPQPTGLPRLPPHPSPGPHHQHSRALRRSLRSSSRLGELRPFTGNVTIAGDMSVPGGGGVGESLAWDTSLDITRFLSRSTNLLSASSSRATRRSLMIKVKEINLDHTGALTLIPEPHNHDTDGQHREEAKNNESSSLGEVSELIAQHHTLPSPSQVSLTHHLSGILETLTSVAGSFTSPPSTGQKRKWETFEDKENQDSDPCPSLSLFPNASSPDLRGIKLQDASFNPQFPEISPGTDAGLFTKGEGNQSTLASSPSDQSVSSKVPKKCYMKDTKGRMDGSGQDGSYLEIWKDFTAILESKTPNKAKPLNFTSNFSWQERAKAAHDRDLKSRTADLSDTPFLDLDPSLKRTPSNSIEQLNPPSDSSVTPSTTCGSLSSASVTTPQRLQDLQVVQLRLQKLKEALKH